MGISPRLSKAVGRRRHEDHSREISRVLATLCWRRGLTRPESVGSFLGHVAPRLDDPFLLPGMEGAVARLQSARASGERVCIYGDFDADGLTATAVLATAFGAIGLDVTTHIPVRAAEGYGLSIAALRRLKAEGVGLVVTVDCGATALEEAEEARRLGLGLVITDHHEPGPELPAADAVVNPKRADSAYPCAELAGVGVALKLVQALFLDQPGVPLTLFSRTTSVENACSDLLDLVALGTVTDIVPLLGENRDLVRAGLRLMDPPVRPGLRALYRIAGLEGKRITAHHLGFQFGPRLNAAGRLGDAAGALRLLLTSDEAEAETIAAELDHENRKRQELVDKTFEEVVTRVDRGDADLVEDRVLVFSGRGWHEGVIGIVASRLVDRYSRPVLMVALDTVGGGRGSGRSIPGFNLVAALRECSSRLTRFGGHAMAAGFDVEAQNLEPFTKEFGRLARNRLAPGDLQRHLNVDACVSAGLLRQAGEELVEALELLEPHGQGNPYPVLALLGGEFALARGVGADKKHLKGVVVVDGHSLDVIGFGMGSMASGLARARGLYDLAFRPTVDEWADRRRVQLKLVDMRPAAPAADVARG